jgi:hypothetical protein
MEEFLIEVRKFAYSEVERTSMPVKAHVDLATETGRRLAKKLGAKVDIVEAGTLLMDCAIGQALKENRLTEHVQMSLDKANELLSKFSLSEEDKENIRHCVLEHHGVNKFYSLESEICCNADCYRFISVKGFLYAVRYLRDMPFKDLVKLLKDKVDEKWGAISLGGVKKELAPQHETILKMLEVLEEKK